MPTIELNQISGMPTIIRTCEPLVCCDDVWEQAYLRFETPAEERRKFRGRLHRLGAAEWPREARIVEIFCGRGNGLVTLGELGFREPEGCDLSERLLRQYRGDATLYVADCRELPFPDASRDVVIVQGGLHHLPELPGDLEAVVCEVHRVLRPGGRFVVVEPWMTPYLRAVHSLAPWKLLQRCWPKIEAFQTMTIRESTTYFAWLAMPETILRMLKSSFRPERQTVAWGKLEYVGLR